jgi:hypothetical protein
MSKHMERIVQKYLCWFGKGIKYSYNFEIFGHINFFHQQLAKSTEMDNKLRTCILVLKKFVNLANNGAFSNILYFNLLYFFICLASENIRAALIMEKVFQIFQNTDHKVEVGLEFMLIFETNVLKSHNVDKSRIKIEDWDRKSSV